MRGVSSWPLFRDGEPTVVEITWNELEDCETGVSLPRCFGEDVADDFELLLLCLFLKKVGIEVRVIK